MQSMGLQSVRHDLATEQQQDIYTLNECLIVQIYPFIPL